MRKLTIGERAIHNRVVKSDDFTVFSQLSGDNNPLHLDEEFARSTRFGRIIAPGLLIGSYFSAIIANDLPGPGSIYLSQSLEFKRPIYGEDLIELHVEVIDFKSPKIVVLQTDCIVDGEAAIRGTALVLVDC